MIKAVEDQPRSPLEEDDAEAMIESVGSSEAGRAHAAQLDDEEGATTGLSSHKKRRDVERWRFFTYTTQLCKFLAKWLRESRLLPPSGRHIKFHAAYEGELSYRRLLVYSDPG